MKRARIITPYIEPTKEIPFRDPAITRAYPMVSFYDVTNIPGEKLPTDVNAIVAAVVAEDDVMQKIQADPAWVKAVLWVEDHAEGEHVAAERKEPDSADAKLIADVQAHLEAVGVASKDASDVLADATGKTDAEVATSILDFLKARPAAVKS